MATLLQCDKCGKISPDANGYFLANNWFTLYVSHGNKAPKNVLLCDACMITTGILLFIGKD
jgi:hypothetical protein